MFHWLPRLELKTLTKPNKRLRMVWDGRMAWRLCVCETLTYDGLVWFHHVGTREVLRPFRWCRQS